MAASMLQISRSKLHCAHSMTIFQLKRVANQRRRRGGAAGRAGAQRLTSRQPHGRARRDAHHLRHQPVHAEQRRVPKFRILHAATYTSWTAGGTARGVGGWRRREQGGQKGGSVGHAEPTHPSAVASEKGRHRPTVVCQLPRVTPRAQKRWGAGPNSVSQFRRQSSAAAG